VVFELGHSGGASPALGVLLLGFQTAATPAFGGTVLLVPAINLSVTIPAPSASVPIAIPNDPNLVGLPIYFQSGQIDAGAVQLLAFSRGLEVRCGTR